MTTSKNMIKLLFVLLFFSLVSCNLNKKEAEKFVEKEDVENQEIQFSESRLADFYSALEKEDYSDCLSYFKKELRSVPGDSLLSLGLSDRNKKMGLSSDFDILYSYSIESESGVEYGFHTKCYNDNDSYHFENLLFIDENGKMVLDNYEYSNLPYVSVEKANDPNSSINNFLSEMYEAINTDDYEMVKGFIDDYVFEQAGEEKIANGFNKKIAIKPNVISFKVLDINTEIMKNVPVINMEIEEITDDFTSVSSVILSVRKDSYYVINIEDSDVILKENAKVFDDVKEDLVMKFVDGFYEALRDSDFKKIVDYIDDDVFLVTQKEIILESFSNRNTYYGTPNDITIVSSKNDKIADRNTVEINLRVNGSNQKRSIEKIILIEYSDSYRIYAYEYDELKD